MTKEKMSKLINQLTTREQEILALIYDEKSCASIAEELKISQRTVETHRKNIYKKTGSKTVVGLIKKMIKSKS